MRERSCETHGVQANPLDRVGERLDRGGELEEVAEGFERVVQTCAETAARPRGCPRCPSGVSLTLNAGDDQRLLRCRG